MKRDERTELHDEIADPAGDLVTGVFGSSRDPSRRSATSRSASSSAAAFDGAHTSARGRCFGSWPFLPAAWRKAVSKPMMVLVLPVPGGPCSSAHQVVSVSLQLQQNCSPLSAAVSH